MPSEIIGIEDGYTSFCFNEACSFIIAKLESGEKPRYIEYVDIETEREDLKHYSSFKELYKTYGG